MHRYNTLPRLLIATGIGAAVALSWYFLTLGLIYHVVPRWIYYPVSAIYVLVGWKGVPRLINRAILPGHCQQCGYDLTGNVSGVCSECGTPVPENRPGR